MSDPVLSHYQLAGLTAPTEGVETCQISLDLGLSRETVGLSAEGIEMPDGRILSWKAVEEIVDATNNCFCIERGQTTKIVTFSELQNRVYSLMPTRGAPTMLISGIPMHRIKDTDPHRDTLAKVRASGRLVGRVLDTATGLGYTAIEASKTADSVLTIELDPCAIEIARQNPWSRQLFRRENIQQAIGDSFDIVSELEDASFDRIVHDPPAFKLAGHLYSAEFYRQMLRVLVPRGRLFHYIGDPESRSGRNITRGVMRRLDEAGFLRIQRRPKAFGVVAVRP